MEKFDAIIIGTGQAGPSLAARCAAEGLKTAVIEKAKFGGTCVNDGCTPTKTLVASAKMAHMARRAEDYGVVINGDISVDMKMVKARKDAIVSKSNTGVENWMKNTKNLTVFEGHARFTSNNTIAVNDKVLTADKIFLNVGGRAYIPEGFEGVDVLTNTEMMDIDFVPEHLIVVGGSYIGLEFGQMYNRFGSKVTIIERNDRLIRREDEDVSAEVQKILEDEGISFRFGATCLGAKMEGDRVVVNVDCEKGDREVRGSHLLLAVGRVPNTDDLGLENTDIKVNARGFIEVDDELKTNVSGVWAMGDVNGTGAFTHTAYNDFEIVAANLFDNDPRRVSDRIMCYGLFIDPALGRIGMTEDQVRRSGRKALMGTRTMVRISRAREKGETYGFMKILVDAETKRILGATILGIEGDEIIHSLLDIMYADKPYTVIQRAVHIHPTVSELIPTTLADLKPLE
ncbi:FAD-containing oxidoreductase [Leptobacterium flavescens]|uniref:FAD-containing oxidoreductase n=1 Tax=Leptobacterium flavescens TaxID=472055 RepID=A0A6P0UJI4_9FLAO|nr:FAD-containing oxidoreductase [Leptobacterium flavescens]NER12088.1 FAD-containing oxidoreductase [Leptobacterium flavescens]